MAALPTTEISTSLVKTALGAGSNDVGTLCTHQNINKWSKWKPVSSNKHEGITTTDLINKKFGLDIISKSTIYDLLTYYSKNSIWNYLKPTGGASSPYRLGDFRNYDHSAYKAFNTTQLNSFYYKTDGKIRNWIYNDQSELTSLIRWDDLGYDDYYFGACIAKKSDFQQNTRFTDPFSVKLGEASSTYVDVLIGDLDLGDYVVAQYITNDNVIGTDQHFIPIPNGYFEVQIKKSALFVIIEGTREGADVDWTLSISNESGSSITLNGVQIIARYGGKTFGSTLESGEKSTSLGSITINANATYNNSGTITNCLPDFNSRTGEIYFENTTQTIINTKDFIQV